MDTAHEYGMTWMNINASVAKLIKNRCFGRGPFVWHRLKRNSKILREKTSGWRTEEMDNSNQHSCKMITADLLITRYSSWSWDTIQLESPQPAAISHLTQYQYLEPNLWIRCMFKVERVIWWIKTFWKYCFHPSSTTYSFSGSQWGWSQSQLSTGKGEVHRGRFASPSQGHIKRETTLYNHIHTYGHFRVSGQHIHLTRMFLGCGRSRGVWRKPYPFHCTISQVIWKVSAVLHLCWAPFRISVLNL